MNKHKITIYTILIASILFGGALYFSYEPEMGNAQIITKEYMVGGERVIINEQPPMKERLFGATEVFKPTVTLYKWQTETWIKIWLDEAGDDFATQVGDKVVWYNTDKSKEVNMYPLASTTQMENGGFEYEVILNEKPKSNVITMKIETQGLDFFYQPALTQKEIDEGAFRPENVVGSYAIFHSTKKDHIKGQTNYMAGKMGQFYRPRVCDSNNWCVWGEFNKDLQITKNLSITIPQDFIDTSQYPIRHATGLTFGYTSTGGTEDGNFANDSAALSKGTPASSGNVSKITFYTKVGYSTTMLAKGVIWTHADNGTVITNGVGGTATVPDPGPAWIDMTYSTEPSVTASTDYYVGAISRDWFIYAYYDSGSAGDGGADPNNYTTPETLDGSLEKNDRKYSIYATYTAGGGGEPEEAPQGIPYIILIE